MENAHVRPAGEFGFFLPSGIYGLNPTFPIGANDTLGAADLTRLRAAWAQMAREALTTAQRDILRTGRAWLDARDNVASGYGFNVHALVARGLLEPGRRFYKEGDPYFRGIM